MNAAETQQPVEMEARRLAGRCANGAERDGGTIWHAVPRTRTSSTALCGATYGRRSAGWSTTIGAAVTCPRCIRRATPKPKRVRATHPYRTESWRILDRLGEHEKAHQCTSDSCHVAKGLQDAWWAMHEAEAPLRVLFEGLHMVVHGVACEAGCGRLTTIAPWRADSLVCASCSTAMRRSPTNGGAS